LKSVVDGLLLFGGAVGGHAGQGQLAGGDNPGDGFAGLGQLLDFAKALGLDKNGPALGRGQDPIGPAGQGAEFVLVAGRIVDRPAQRLKKGVEKLVDDRGFGNLWMARSWVGGMGLLFWSDKASFVAYHKASFVTPLCQ
jgi:hypothetical protein